MFLACGFYVWRSSALVSCLLAVPLSDVSYIVIVGLKCRCDICGPETNHTCEAGPGGRCYTTITKKDIDSEIRYRY